MRAEDSLRHWEDSSEHRGIRQGVPDSPRTEANVFATRLARCRALRRPPCRLLLAGAELYQLRRNPSLAPQRVLAAL